MNKHSETYPSPYCIVVFNVGVGPRDENTYNTQNLSLSVSRLITVTIYNKWH